MYRDNAVCEINIYFGL